MKLMLTGDLHLTDKAPTKRLDDYFKTQKKKVEELIDLYKKKKCDLLLQPGDLFDSHRASYNTTQTYLSIFRQANIPLLFVLGQHDLRYHTSNIDNIPSAVLRQGADTILLGASPYIKKRVHIYGQSWFEKTPKIVSSKRFNVLVVHKMLYSGKEDFPGQAKQAAKARDFLEQQKFDLIVSGDNHKQFIVQLPTKCLVNLGSLMRNRIDQDLHRPSVGIFDTDKKTLFVKRLEVKSFRSVFDVSREREEKEQSEELQNFIKEITSGKTKKLDFISRLKAARDKTTPNIARIFDDVMEGADLKWT